MRSQRPLKLSLGRRLIALLIKRQAKVVVKNRESGVSPYQFTEGANGGVALPLLEINVTQRIGKAWLSRRLLESPFGQLLRFIQIAVVTQEECRVVERRRM
jgi:hypothetical protein